MTLVLIVAVVDIEMMGRNDAIPDLSRRRHYCGRKEKLLLVMIVYGAILISDYHYFGREGILP